LIGDGDLGEFQRGLLQAVLAHQGIGKGGARARILVIGL
jgi:hypothetical protein